MQERTIYLTEKDMKRLRELVMVARSFGKEEEKYLRELENELNRAKIVKPEDIPPNVITMNSEVSLKDLNTGEESVYRLVFPDNADISNGRLSILAPIGTALIGYAEGDIIEWPVPSGTAKLKVTKILFQPEAAGNFDL